LLAINFAHVTHNQLTDELRLTFDERGNLRVGDQMMTNVPGVFAAGDAVAGASLVVRAFRGGRQVAAAVDRYLRR
jgi:glutamate synthase (NADPH/NADH) small chain